MTQKQRRSVHSAGSPSRTPQPTKGANPDGRTPAELPSDTAASKDGGTVALEGRPAPRHS